MRRLSCNCLVSDSTRLLMTCNGLLASLCQNHSTVHRHRLPVSNPHNTAYVQVTLIMRLITSIIVFKIRAKLHLRRVNLPLLPPSLPPRLYESAACKGRCYTFPQTTQQKHCSVDGGRLNVTLSSTATPAVSVALIGSLAGRGGGLGVRVGGLGEGITFRSSASS